MWFKKFLKGMLVVGSLSFFSVSASAAPWILMNLTYDGAVHKYNAESVYLYINGTEIKNLTMPPIIMNSTTLVPAREVFEPLGAVVDWKKETYEVLVAYNGNIISIAIDSNIASVNGQSVSMSMPAKIINNKTMIPVRFIAEALGLEVNWVNEERAIKITQKAAANNQNAQNSAQTEAATEVTTENKTEAAEEVFANINDIGCEDGILKIDADNLLGDFSVLGSSSKTVIAFDIYKAASSISQSYNFKDEYVKKVDIIQIQEKPAPITRVVIEMNSEVKNNPYIGNNGKSFIVEFGNSIKSTGSVVNEGLANVQFNLSENFGYDEASRSFVIKKNSLNVDLSAVKHTDNYNAKEYIINMNVNLGNISNSTHTLNSALLESVNVNSDSGSTVFTIKEKNIYAYDITDDENNIYIKVLTPKEKYSKIVVVDAGHGDGDNGASGSGMHEKNLNLAMALKLVKLLEGNNIKAYATRLDDTFLELNERVAFANEVGDLFISIHQNSFTSEKANGTETWHYPHANDAELGYTSEEFAKVVQNNLISKLGSLDRGVKSTNYVVIKNTNIPAVLCEIGFISNPSEASKLGNDSYQQLVAQALCDSVLTAFSSYVPKR